MALADAPELGQRLEAGHALEVAAVGEVQRERLKPPHARHPGRKRQDLAEAHAPELQPEVPKGVQAGEGLCPGEVAQVAAARANQREAAQPRQGAQALAEHTQVAQVRVPQVEPALPQQLQAAEGPEARHVREDVAALDVQREGLLWESARWGNMEH